MKKILFILLIAFFALPSVVLAQTQSVSLTITPDSDFSQYAQCDGDQFCQQVRQELITTLKEIIQKLLVQVQELQQERSLIEDLSGITDTTYRIKADTTLAGESIGAVNPTALLIWQDFKKVAPAQYIENYLANYRVYFDDDDFTAAYVETDKDDDKKWVLGVNLADSNFTSTEQHKSLIETLIHEFAHIVTLNESQIDLSVSERRCGTTWLDPGCSFKNSYSNEFVEEFWTENDFDHSERIARLEDEEDIEDETDQYFENNPGDFVTPYATTHPAEDIAESFAYFVIYNESDENTKEAEKINFFYQFEELVEIRNNARDNFKELFNL